MPDGTAVADQPKRESPSDQAQPANGRDKPLEDSPRKVKLPTGEEVDESELVNGYMRGSDYTRKTQELAEQRRSLGRGEDPRETPKAPSDEGDEVRKRLNEFGVATKDDVESIVEKRLAKEKAEAEDKANLNAVIESNPELKGKRKLLESIGKTDKRAWEDIVKDPEYGLLPDGKLERAKQPQVMGDRNNKDKSNNENPDFKTMSGDDLDKWEREQGITGRIPLSKVQKIR